MRVSRSLSFWLLLVLLAPSLSWAEAPVLRSYVTDLAGVLAAQDRDRLEAFLQDYDAKSGNQFVVLIVQSLEGGSIEEYALSVAETNRIGREGEDNGLLFLVAVGDRKMRFEVGYGLEGVLTDAFTSVIISDVVAPEFRRGDYAAGIIAGMSTAVKAASGELTLAQSPRREREKKEGGNLFGLIIFLVILFFVLKGNRGRGGGGIWFIGPFGGGGGGLGGGGFGGGGGFSGFSGGGGSFGGGGSSGSW
jgi:uncharacterized protein